VALAFQLEHRTSTSKEKAGTISDTGMKHPCDANSPTNLRAGCYVDIVLVKMLLSTIINYLDISG
jgi:hypothetical protein